MKTLGLFRSSLCLAALALSLAAQAQQSPLTAKQVIERVLKQTGVAPLTETTDTFKAGDPETPVKGVAVTMMATLEVLQKAVSKGCNLIISHEPTFYDHMDKTQALESENDPVWIAKRDYIKKHGLVIWRFHDYWHLRKPDGILTGMIRALGLDKYRSAKHEKVFAIPTTTLGKLAADIKKRMGVRTLRVVGDPTMKVSKLGLDPGFPGFASQKSLLQRADVEVLIMGEAHEWETIEYGTDAVTAKKKKALLILGHIPSEQAGMEECARWMKTFVKEVPVLFTPASEPFWSPP